MKIFFLEDDPQVSFIIQKTIENAGYQAFGFDLSEKMIKTLEIEIPDLILLDIMMPDISGFDVLKLIRKFYKDIPIIMISALGSEMDKVKGLDLGADDYITKPFGVLELTSRIQAQLRKTKVKQVYQKENLILDKTNHQCLIDEEVVYLTNKEFDILAILLNHDGQIVTKEQLFNEVWQMDATIETRTLDMHIKSLRQKIQAAAFKIETIRGIGYRI